MGEHNEEALECDFDGLAVLCSQEVDVVADDVAFFVESEDGVGVAGVGQVGEDVADLAPDVVGVSLEEFKELFEEIFSGEDGFGLRLDAGCDVGDDPAGLAPHHLLVVLKHSLQVVEDPASQQLVGLLGRARRDVSQDADRRHYQRHCRLLEILYDPPDHVRVHHCLDLVLVCVGVVRDSPATVRHYLPVRDPRVRDSPAQHRDRRLYQLVLGQGTSSAKVT